MSQCKWEALSKLVLGVIDASLKTSRINNPRERARQEDAHALYLMTRGKLRLNRICGVSPGQRERSPQSPALTPDH